MLIALVALAVVFVLAAGLLVRERLTWLARHTKQRVIVQTSEDQTLDGVLLGAHSDGLVLADTRIVGDNVVIAGQVWVPRPKVQFIQVPAREA